MKLTLEKIAKYTGGTVRGDKETVIRSAAIDSRKLGEACLFIALKGENTDGHCYVDQAFAAGAAAALVIKEKYSGASGSVVETGDTAAAMGDIAAGILRERGDALIKIAVTGSVGKTSTKDMIASVVGGHFITLKSELNHNNELGLPLTIMQLEEHHEALVTEMGMRGLGQIEYLTNIVRPDIAVITNIGISHLETLGTRENILRAKLEICKGMKQGGKLILNGDNDLLSDETLVRNILQEYGADRVELIYFGTEENSDYRAENIRGSNYELFTPAGQHFSVRLQVPGVHNVYNSMAAVCAANAAGISAEEAVDTLYTFGEEASRQKIVETPWGFVIDDTYNAGPESMLASLGVLRDMEADLKIAALGDMLELGALSEESHRKVGAAASEIADVLLAVGPQSAIYYDIFHGQRKMHVSNSAEGARALAPVVREYAQKGLKIGVLVKGSNAIRMHLISEALLDNFT
ncbi:MAG: UDP-N-acetylmuramoyl-tripeptide--D-alanyl-D-alanine ligase [Clostridia bacterium]